MSLTIGQRLTQRFFRYLAISSQSDAKATTVPSTPGQWDMVKLLAEELAELGCVDINIDEHAVLTAKKVGNQVHAPAIGFIAHTDTVNVGLSAVIKPQLLRFEGQDLCLNAEKDIWLRVEERPEINAYLNEDIIFSDGTSVLGADNKAAITAIMQMLDYYQAHPQEPHGDLYICFAPDEEIGLRGAKVLDLKKFPVDFAYTIDCCELGELVYETFNAATAQVTIQGVTAHPMSAKNVLVNPLKVAYDFMGYFDPKDTPEHTEGKEGYFWFNDLQANQSQAKLSVSIRDHDLNTFNARKSFFMEALQLIKARHPRADIQCEMIDLYSNIANALATGADKTPIDLLFKAYSHLGIQPKVIAMRGGTDGSALSARGILTPNYFTGAHNFHSAFEFLPVSSFVKSYEVTLELCRLAAQR